MRLKSCPTKIIRKSWKTQHGKEKKLSLTNWLDLFDDVNKYVDEESPVENPVDSQNAFEKDHALLSSVTRQTGEPEKQAEMYTHGPTGLAAAQHTNICSGVST